MAADAGTQDRDFDWDIPQSYSIPSVVAHHAEHHGERTAVRFVGRDDSVLERTYADLRDDMHRFAGGLSTLGIGRGDRVMHLFPRHPDAFAIQLGILEAGAIVVSCSSMLQPNDLTYRANDCKASAIVVHESLLEMIEPKVAETPIDNVIVLDGSHGESSADYTTVASLMARGSARFDGPGLSASDPMTINYTSGTTGKPKPVLHKHRWMYCFERINAPYWWGIDDSTDLDGELLWATTGTGWAKWFWSPVGVGLTRGATQLLSDTEFDADRYLSLMEREGVTRLCSVPTEYRLFAKADLASYDLDVTEFLSAGEPLNREAIERIEAAFGVTPRSAYGQTETVALVGNCPGMEVKPGSMGRPLPGTDTTIIDLEAERPVENDEIGEIAVPADEPVVFDGYYERPALDKQTFSGEYYRTGDLARRDDDGYLFFEGRADDIIISAGYRIGPFEVEDALVAHEAVIEAGVVGSPHEERGHVVKAFVVLSAGYEPSDDLAATLQDHAKRETAPYKYPRRIEFVNDLPKTASGKIRRVELREREQ